MRAGFEEVFRNYIYVPIITTIIGSLFTVLIPKFLKWIQKNIRKRINKSVDNIDIFGKWKSFFHEENSILSESIELQQEGQIVKGKINYDKGNEKRTYLLNGEFKNQILIATYVSNQTRKDERGSIVLRRINEKLLSGYCTFVYQDKQVYSSPYVLTSMEYHDIEKGTFNFCANCHGELNCCCNCNKIDTPIVLPFEAQNISIKTKKPINDFAEEKRNLYQMKRLNGQEDNECIFFVNNRCSIYDDRPIDCRLFPFDFKEINGEYWLICYNDIKICKALPSDIREIKNYAHIIRPLLDMLLPYMSEFTNSVFSEKLEKQEYKFIKLFTITSLKEDISN